MENVYFALTEAFNREAPTVALASGQAVVFYRIAIMSKDGDWDLWFDLAQATNASDSPYTHGVFATPRRQSLKDHLLAMPDAGTDNDFIRPDERRRSG